MSMEAFDLIQEFRSQYHKGCKMLLLSCWRSRARSPAGSFCKQCDFGFNCRFSHMTEEDLEKLNAQVQEERRPKEEGAEVPAGTVEDWLEKRAKRLSFAQSNSSLTEKTLVFQYPPGWPPIQDLPPSLQAPPPGGWPVLPNLQWG
ncbi:zinc finger matrin-type protein 5 isoform X2 [Lepidochelys kempii]|uniref:zinc finger matrin-type protein 5 isoform X2 n=1 Tax=Lepidochelys kempii TaxID=8472 RepID=UPI003C6EFC99